MIKESVVSCGSKEEKVIQICWWMEEQAREGSVEELTLYIVGLVGWIEDRDYKQWEKHDPVVWIGGGI